MFVPSHYLIQTECEVILSGEVLNPVIKALDLDREWGKRYGGGEPLKPAETMALLKGRLDIRPLRNASIIAIKVYSSEPDEAARLANEIAEIYKNHASRSSFQVEIVDRASPAFRPIRPNKPLNLAIGMLLGLVLGAVAGVAGVVLRDRKSPG